MIEPPAVRGRPPISLIIAVVLIVALAALIILGALTAFQLPSPVTAEGKKIKTLYQATLAISFIVYFLVTAGIIWAIFRYRRRGPEIPVQVHGSSLLEITWTVIPILILVGLFIPAVVLVIDLKTPPAAGETDLTVEAIGHQWWWEFDYPDQKIKVQATPPNYEDLDPPRLVVPVGKNVVIRVRSTDVVHSFYAPHALYKMQAIPGNVNEMHLKVEKAGEYHGQCYQFCGHRHSDMLCILDARDEAGYQQWVTQTQRTQGVTPPADQALSLPAEETPRSP